MDVKGKVFFITGGAQGLGKLYAHAVLDKGAKVFFGDLNVDAGEATLKELQDKHGADSAKFKAFDVTDKDAFEGAFKQAVSEFGQIDVHVNNAGIMNEGLWELMIKINVTAVIHGTKLATEHMRKDKGGKGGRIINISSVAGLDDVPCLSIYAGTKHAVRTYTSSLSKQPDQEAKGIEYALLCPHAAATDLVLKLDDTGIDFPETFLSLINGMAMPPETVADGFMKLVTLNKMNGAILRVDKDGCTFRKMEHTEVDAHE